MLPYLGCLESTPNHILGTGERENCRTVVKVGTEIIKKYTNNEEDNGSTEVQIAVLTEEINVLTNHLKENIHDFHSKRGLLMKVGKRRNLLNYLKKTDINRYRELIKSLGLRK